MKKFRVLAAIPIIFVFFVVAIIVGAIGLFVVSNADKISNFMVFSEIPKEEAGISVYFCRDANVSCSQKFIDVINNAEDYVYCAFYSISEDSVITAINSRNITTKIVLETDNYIDLKSPAKRDLNPYLMHDKFCVTDKEIITGSFNPTIQQEKYDDNNVILSNSSYLRENYIQEFYQLYDGNLRKTPYPKIIIGNVSVENYFCPKDACEKHVLSVLQKASSSIKFMTFSFTSNPIGDLLVSKEKQGINVTGVFEKMQENKWSQKNKLEVNGGCSVYFDGNKKLMHHKVFIVDDSLVITGSYNPTDSGNRRNDENILIIHDNNIAEKYVFEFDRIWNMSKDQ